MALVDLLRRRRFVVVAIGGALIGAVVGLFLPIRAADPPKADEARWSLPNAQALKRFREDQFQAVRRARFWGELAMPGRRGANVQPVWTLQAIVTRPQVQVAVSTVANGKSVQSWVRIGGTLPDGATLVAVNPDRVWYVKDDCRRMRSLYQVAGKPDADACAGQPSASASSPSPASSQSPPPSSSGRPPSPPPAPAPAGKPH